MCDQLMNLFLHIAEAINVCEKLMQANFFFLNIACGCSLFGSVREDCEQMTGRCVCKPDIQGQKCTICNDHNKILTSTGCYSGITII